eukprot:scaffold19528_cov70-Cyclotella_meneghiniana.AAC.1
MYEDKRSKAVADIILNSFANNEVLHHKSNVTRQCLDRQKFTNYVDLAIELELVPPRDFTCDFSGFNILMEKYVDYFDSTVFARSALEHVHLVEYILLDWDTKHYGIVGIERLLTGTHNSSPEEWIQAPPFVKRFVLLLLTDKLEEINKENKHVRALFVHMVRYMGNYAAFKESKMEEWRNRKYSEFPKKDHDGERFLSHKITRLMRRQRGSEVDSQSSSDSEDWTRIRMRVGGQLMIGNSDKE